MDKIDISIVKWIQSNLRSNFMDYLMYMITQIGSSYFFIVLVVLLYWLVDKRFAYKFFFAFVGSALFNSIFKVIVKRVRPYTYEGITDIFETTHGYSFPSGHSQATGVIYYSMMDEYGKKNKVVKGLLIATLILVPFSRVYLGQHFLTDVLVGALIGLIVSHFMFKLFDKMKDKEHIYPLYAIPVIIIALLFFVGKDYGSYKDLFVAGGGYIGFTISYALEKLYVKHNVVTNITNKVLKALIGLVSTFAIYFILKEVFPDQSLIFDFIRYLIVTCYAGLAVPFIFTKIFKNK
ncbi:phosphatase PAP2 family protein [Haploplasma axanthum]|uniref:Phosphatidylglycerophosphatase B n=1 Tax=Haploplasma axanthum TaxID=29552 RepID=A0A449BDY6_HAPAX|nr:phosphatase PAP2 family protein [Haploplasma axanthum]VEU80659.1 phosphatidylglycerophosphatase B [Haploplasma axanthum]